MEKWTRKPIIKVITGIRRSLKSYIMKMIADLLREKGVSEEEIIFLNLELYENRRLLDLDELLVSSEVINREYRSLLEIRDAYPKMVLFMDKVPIDTRDGIRHKNIIDFLPEE